jgi:hypothetical protein
MMHFEREDLSTDTMALSLIFQIFFRRGGVLLNIAEGDPENIIALIPGMYILLW